MNTTPYWINAMIPPRTYRSKKPPTDVNTFEGVMLEHVNYVIYQSRIEKDPAKRDLDRPREFGPQFSSVWESHALPEMPLGPGKLQLLHHGSPEVSAGWKWRKGKTTAAEEGWRFVVKWNSLFPKMMEPLTSMAVTEKEKNDVPRIWRQHQNCLRQYFQAVPRYGYKNLSRPMKVCQAVAAELGGLLDILANRLPPTSFEGVMLRHVNDVIAYEKQSHKRMEWWEKYKKPLSSSDFVADFFKDVWNSFDKLPKFTRSGRRNLMFHGEWEAVTDEETLHRIKSDKKEADSKFLKSLDPLKDMASTKEKKDVDRLWWSHVECMKKYFKRQLYKTECLTSAAEFGALLDKLAARTHSRSSSSVGSRISTEQQKKEEDGMSGLSSKFEGQQTKYWN